MREFELNTLTQQPKYVTVVRLRTTMWGDEKSLSIKKSITLQKRKSYGYNVVFEDVSQSGAEEVIPRILNLDKQPDGLYTVVMINERRDRETGYVEDYDYWLVPFVENGHEVPKQGNPKNV